MENKLVTFLLLTSIVLLTLLNVNSCRSLRGINQRSVALESNVIKHQRLQDSSYLVSMRSLEISNDILLGKIAIQDTLLDYAIKLLRTKGATQSTVIQTIERYYSKDTTTILQSDTVRRDSFIYIYPTYAKKFSDKWINYSFEARFDTIIADITFFNEISYVVTQKRDKWWQPLSTHIDVHSKSPYSTITDLEHVVVKNRVPRLGLGLSVGYGITSNLKPAGFIGVSLSYRLITLDFKRWLRKKPKDNIKTLLDSN